MDHISNRVIGISAVSGGGKTALTRRLADCRVVSPYRATRALPKALLASRQTLMDTLQWPEAYTLLPRSA
jgi:hypothetical protein